MLGPENFSYAHFGKLTYARLRLERYTLRPMETGVGVESHCESLPEPLRPPSAILSALPATECKLRQPLNSINHFQHSLAVVEEGVSVGDRTRVWAFAHLVSGASVGSDCNVCDHTFIEGNVRIGDRVTIKCGVSLWDGVVVENDVFIGPNVVFTNDKHPRSRVHPASYPQITLKQGCSLGANSTILPGVTIGRWAMIGAGAVVTEDVPDFGLVVGVPARLSGWVCRCGQKLSSTSDAGLSCDCGLRYAQSGERQVSLLES